MASAAVRQVWEKSRARNGALLVLLAIADESGKDGMAVMNIAEIAAKARLSNRAVQLAVRGLKGLGELSAVTRGGGPARTSYRVTVANPEESAQSPDANPEKSAGLADPNPEKSAPPKNLHPAESAGLKPDNPQVSVSNPADSAPWKISDVISTSTDRSVVEIKEVSEKRPGRAERPDVERLCRLLADRIEGNGSKRPEIGKKWRDAARLMLDKDGRSEEQVTIAINWCQDHEFWRSNILSMPKLREKYDQLRLQAAREQKSSARKTTGDRVRQAVEAGHRVAAMMNGETPR